MKDEYLGELFIYDQEFELDKGIRPMLKILKFANELGIQGHVVTGLEVFDDSGFGKRKYVFYGQKGNK